MGVRSPGSLKGELIGRPPWPDPTAEFEARHHNTVKNEASRRHQPGPSKWDNLNHPVVLRSRDFRVKQ
jgi:hypothetical protein